MTKDRGGVPPEPQPSSAPEPGAPPPVAPPPAGTAHVGPPTSTAALRELRQALDKIDEDLVGLIARRMDTVARVIREKKGQAGGIRDPRREHEILTRVEALARTAGVSAPLARRIFSEILANSVARQASTLTGLAPGAEALRVAYVGTPYTYNHLASEKFVAEIGQQAEFLGLPSIKEAVAALEAGSVDLALLNIESTAAGSLNQVYDVLREKDLHIVGEETVTIDLCLCGVAEVPLQVLEQVLSHPLALDQCSQFIEALPRARPVPAVDTAEALRLVAERQDPTQAAIGSPEGAEAHGLMVLRRGIGNHEEILHRYVVLARSPTQFDPRIPCKTSLILTARHEQGSLLRCLQALSEHGISLTKLESRPNPDRPWEYMFFIDFEGNISDPAVAEGLGQLRARALYLKVLGCYPSKARPVEAHLTGLSGTPPAGTPVAATEPPPPSTPPRPRTRQHGLADRAAQPDDTLVRVGNLLIGGNGFVVMAGPASVESEAEILETAQFVRAGGAHVLRGRVPTPEARDWLTAAGRSVGMPVVTEVLSPEDVRPLADRVDILQVGARNMQNFALLRELGRVNRPVLLKRGLSATIDEWLAAADYILSQGNGQVILCERGIRTFESATASTLDLSAVVVLKERTHLPVVVDPSQGTGRRDYVAPMAWAARACGAHGLLIEVHPRPGNATSDGQQSLDFSGFTGLMAGLGRWHA
jgi:chorismate mutase/prephenate dehydratase